MATETLATGTRVIELDIQGMTCASCVARVERKLGKLDGVEASVNLPLESAQVTVPDSITDQQILDTVTATGYSAALKASGGSRDVQDADAGTTMAEGLLEGDRETRSAGSVLLPRLLLAAALTLPVVVISMVPAVQFPHWGWAVFALSLPSSAGLHGRSTMLRLSTRATLRQRWIRWFPSGSVLLFYSLHGSCSLTQT